MIIENTLAIKKFAETIEAQTLLSIQVGNEIQLLKIGDFVKSSELATISLNGVVLDIYVENGYFRYVVEYNASKKKKSTEIMRTKDIVKI